jgi:hypothetical protein
MQWLPANGVPGSRPGAQYPLSPIWKYGLGGIHGDNNYCGPNGAGMPLNANDWACAMHDYNLHTLSATGSANIFDTLDSPSIGNDISRFGLLQLANVQLANNVTGAEGFAIREVVGLSLSRLSY